MLLFALALQAAAPAAATPEKFSILYDPCEPGRSADVVVCAKDGTASDRLPLPDDAPPVEGYVKPDSRDYRDNAMNEGTPCVATQAGCQVGFGPPIVPMIVAAAKAIGDASKDRRWAKARTRDGAQRQAIDLDAAPAGRLEP